MRKLLSSVVCGCLLAGVSLAAQTPQSPSAALTAIAGQGLLNSHANVYLERLSDDIGGRVTGSPQAQQAVNWAVEQMKEMGLQNVHTEAWQLWQGWQRISADAEMIAPVRHPLMIDSMGWVGSTAQGGVDAEVVPVNLYQMQQEMQHNSSHWAGKVLLMEAIGPRPADHMSTFTQFGGFLKKAYEAHAVAIIGGQGGARSTGMHITHTGILGFAESFQIPVVSMAAEDQAQIQRFLDRGKKVVLHINVQNRFSPGPVPSANVVGEIVGTQDPQQVIVAGGHLDSWDLAEGATDDGSGVAVTLGAARAILQSGYKPRRTIRFVLFTGEEQGLLGSLAYVKEHKNEMKNHVAALILDEGQGPVVDFQTGGRDDIDAALTGFAKTIHALGDIKVNNNAEFGEDTGPFILAGLPGINLDQDSPNYRYTHHSVVDTVDHQDPAILDRNTTIMALTAFWIANRPERLAKPWNSDKTAKMLAAQHQEDFLKAVGLWTFGPGK